MPKYKYPKKGSDDYIPEAEYRVAANFCQCYDGWKMRLAIINATIGAYETQNATVPGVNMDGMPHGTDTGDPTGNAATRNMEAFYELIHERDRVAYRVKLIEHTTQRVCGDVLFPYVMRGITKREPHHKLQASGMPCTRKEYGNLRRRVYYELSRLI